MLDIHVTRHAQERLRQRGYRDTDITMLLRVAEPFGEDVYRLSNQVAQRAIERLKGAIRQIERLTGSIAVICEGALVTIHHGEKALRSRNSKKERRYDH